MSWLFGREISWLIPYTTSLFKFDSALLKYMTQKKDTRQWLGMMESIIALAYKRFRPGAKLNIKGFKITNDHSYKFQVMDHQVDFQGLKRSFMGGTSSDMLNLKTPIYYSYHILKLIPEEEREILLRLALESVNFLKDDTYINDLTAQECLNGLQLIIKRLQKEEFEPAPELEDYLCINENYMEHPFTQKNLEIWSENLDLLVEICQEFEKAYKKYINGGDYEMHLERISRSKDRIQNQMAEYYDNLTRV